MSVRGVGAGSESGRIMLDFYGEEELVVDAGHGVGHDGLVFGVEEVVDGEFGR